MLVSRISAIDLAEDADDRRDLRLIAGAVVSAAIYATLRYNVFKGVAWAEWPHYVGNKVMAVASLLLLAAAAVRLVRGTGAIRRLMSWASLLAFAHVFLSLALMNPAYFPSYQEGDRLTFTGGASTLLGAAAIALLQSGNGRPGAALPHSAALSIGIICLLSGIHAGLPSVATWLDPARWPGALPPLTLISSAVGIGAISAVLFAKSDPSSEIFDDHRVDEGKNLSVAIRLSIIVGGSAALSAIIGVGIWQAFR